MRNRVARCLWHAAAGAFFRIIAETLRELLGADWSTEIEDAWRKLLDQIDHVVTTSHTAAQQVAPVSGLSSAPDAYLRIFLIRPSLQQVARTVRV